VGLLKEQKAKPKEKKRKLCKKRARGESSEEIQE